MLLLRVLERLRIDIAIKRFRTQHY
jgi:hypothetical protein